MNTRKLLHQLQKQGVELWVDGKKLRYRAPAGAIKPSMREVLKNRRAEIIDLLNHPTVTDQTHADSKPLSFAQKRIWFFEQLIPGSPVYNAHCVFRITGTLNIYALQASLNEIVRRHSILRSECLNTDSGPVQKISPELQVHMLTIELSENDVFDRERKALEIATTEVRRPFDLLIAPFLRTTLLKLDGRTYILVLVTHHFVMDGYSFRTVFMKELSLLYESFLKGKPSPLPELSIQFHDYVEIEQTQMETGQWETHVEHWHRKLERIPLLMQLPTDRRRPRINTYRGAVRRFSITNPLSEEIKTLSRRAQVSLFMTYLAAFQALLQRYTHETRIVTGTTITHRPFLKTEDLIGPFANNLVLVTDVSDDPTFKDLCKRVYNVTTKAYSHQDLPFEKLVESLRPDRNLSHNPIFQFLFMFHENSQGANFQLSGTSAQWLPVDSRTSRFDLTVEVTNDKDEVAGAVEYNTDLYTAGTVDLLVEHLLNFLRCVARDPDRRISEIDFLTDAERIRMAPAGHTGKSGSRPTICVHKLFERQAAKNPEAHAVVCGRERMTFHELNQRANTLARHLKKCGAGPDEIVGICCDRSTSLIVGLMGILKAGAAYLPLDPAYPPARLAFMMQDARAKILITRYDLEPSLPEHSGQIVYIDHFTQANIVSESPDPRSEVHANHLAYLIYTSGSTGRPKGVAVEHHSISAFLHWAKDIWSNQERAGVLASTSICFDLSVFEIFLPLCFGGCVVLVENIFELLSAKMDADVTLINSTPSVIAELTRLGKIPASVKTVNLAGEKLSRELPEALYKSKNIQNVYNLYGPTEDTVYSTFYRVPPGELRLPPIGRPIPGTSAFILDQILQPVPFGVAGELYLNGDGLARSYWNHPMLTADWFIKNPSGRKTGNRIYRTGDMARILPDGNLEFLGRCDDQIKLHGFRIEPGEIESALRDHPDVQDAAVIAKSGEKRDVHMIAYLISEFEEKLIATEMRAFLKLRLPNFMIPSIFLLIDSIPLTPNGKLDRQALPEPNSLRPNLYSVYRMPRNLVEKVIARIWQDVLNIERVDIHDNFFDLGGHSLLLVQVHSKLENNLKLDLSLIEMFKYPTIRDLTKHIMQEHLDSSFYMRVHRRAEKQIKALNRRKSFLMRRLRSYE